MTVAAPADARLAWEDPPRRAPRDTAPVLAAEGFEGPLDWLLEMARARRIDLARLPIAALIADFAAALETALARPAAEGPGSPGPDPDPDPPGSPALARWGDWLVMAATLLHLRSCLLMPRAGPAADAARREPEALRAHLLERARMGAAAAWLDRRTQLGREVFGPGRPETGGRERSGDIADLLRACLTLLALPDEPAASARRPPPLWRVPDALARIATLLATLPPGSALEEFLPAIPADAVARGLRCRAAVASTFVAGLELARGGTIEMDQDAPWRPIRFARAGAADTPGQDMPRG